jgi:hypothetical protein
MALSRFGSAYLASPLDLIRESVGLVSGESGVPLSPGNHEAVAWRWPAARSCTTASRSRLVAAALHRLVLFDAL